MQKKQTLSIGADLPDFSLTNVDNTLILGAQFVGSPLLIIFMCNRSLFVKHIHGVLLKVIWEYENIGIKSIAINPNVNSIYQEDHEDIIRQELSWHSYSFPYLVDHNQNVAKLFGVTYVPDFFVFDKHGKLAYHGQMDDSRPGNGFPVTGRDLRLALNHVFSGNPVTITQKPSSGSSLLWKDPFTLPSA